MQMIGVRLDDDCPIIGKTVRDICDEERDFRFGIVAVLRDSESHVPWSEFEFQSSDTAYFVIKTERLESCFICLEKKQFKQIRCYFRWK